LRFWSACLAVACSAVVTGQQRQQEPSRPQPSFKASTQLVSIFATVVDADKRLVPSLTQDDFDVLDNDKPQTIAFFNNEIQPITVIVMLDTSLSMTGSIELLRQAAEQFVLRLLPADKGRLGAFNDKIQLSERFTSDRDELVSEIKDLDFGNGTKLW